MAEAILTKAQMRDWEQAAWAAGQTEAEVIRQVGARVAAKARELAPADGCVLILAGPGHNGDDARAAAQALSGRAVELLNVPDPAAALPELAKKLAAKPALIIDGLFGIGLNRALEGDWAALVGHINGSGAPVLAIDTPSGLDADTGQPLGTAVKAAVTLAVGAVKHGLLLHEATKYVGRLEVAADVGLGPQPAAGELRWTTGRDFTSFPPARAAASHKGTYGHLAIVAGSLGYHGAAVLATRGALRARPGLITLHAPEGVYYPVAAQMQSAMVSVLQPDTKLPGPWTGMLIGPGLAGLEAVEPMKLLTRSLWRDSALPLVVDASAIDWLPTNAYVSNPLRIITPHPGEAARILRIKAEEVQADRFAAVRSISRQFSNAWVVLKGHQTVIGRGTGELWVNSSGNPGLAQGGSGDVLSGFIAGWLAQPALRKDVLTALRYAVYEHGAAADRLTQGRRNWIIDELPDELGAV